MNEDDQEQSGQVRGIAPSMQELMKFPVTKVQKKVRHRLTVVEHIYPQLDGSSGRELPSFGYSTDLESDQEVYTCWPKSTTEPRPIDLGWLSDKKIGMLIFKNLETNRPTDRDYALQVRVDGQPMTEVYPGESCRFRSLEGSQVTVYSVVPVKYVLCVVPA